MALATDINFNFEDDHERGLKAVVDEMTIIGLELERHAADILDDGDKNVDGTLKKSITSEVRVFLMEIVTLLFGSNAKHAPFVHFGTAPHWPPPEPILRWVEKKINPPLEEIEEIAFLVARKIANEGTEEFPFIDEALDKVRKKFGQRVEAAYLLAFNGRF